MGPGDRNRRRSLGKVREHLRPRPDVNPAGARLSKFGIPLGNRRGDDDDLGLAQVLGSCPIATGTPARSRARE